MLNAQAPACEFNKRTDLLLLLPHNQHSVLRCVVLNESNDTDVGGHEC